ncbi:MAG: cupin domain-containing protein [Oceanicoccus sp.]
MTLANQETVTTGDIFDLLPGNIDTESFDILVKNDNVRIERIVSNGHSSPDSGWYDQDHNEWVIILRGEATIALEDDQLVNLKAGRHLNIPAHTKHKVAWTKENTETVWIAVHY